MNVLAFAPGDFSMPFPVIVLGTIIGMTYGLLAVGLVLIYRSNRIINFAHGEIGAFAAAVFGLSVVRWHVPYYVALPLALALGGAVAASAETAVIRRLRKAPRLMSIVATLGVGQFLVAFGSVVNSQAGAGSLFPNPPGMPVFNIGALRITPAYAGMLIFAPLVVIALAAFLRFHKWGLGIRSAAANPEAARLSGIFAGRMSTLAWALAGSLSTFTAVLVLPSRGFSGGDSFGPSLLLRALVGAVLARMESMPRALAGGIALGIAEQLLLWNYPQGGLVEVMLFVIILAALLVQRRGGGREEEKGSWTTVQPWRPIPERLRRVWVVRNMGRIFGIAALAFAALLPLMITSSSSVTATFIVAFSIVGLSVGIIAGLGGQLSLGQFALAAIGATVSWQVSRRTGNFGLSILYAGLTVGGVGLLIGLPALRVRGLMLAVTSLSFALVVPVWLLQQSWMLGDGVDPGRPIIAGHALDTGKSYYYFALGILVVAFVLARNVRSGGFGRLLVAVRDNEDNARAFTVRASLVKMQGFVLAGFLAGVGGVVYGHSLSLIGSASFPTSASIDVVAITVIGGIGILAGPLIGALYIIGIPAFLPLDSAGIAATKLGWLLLILYVPGGIAQLLEPARDRLLRWLGRRAGVDLSDEGPQEERPPPNVVVRAAAAARPTGTMLLECTDLRKSFGGVVAVDEVSLHVRAGEILGLIGPNGAGKTTLFELLSGFTMPDRGRVRFDGRDVSPLGPEARGRLGLIRSFQDAALFPTMTVFDAVRLAHERVLPTSLLSSVVGFSAREREKANRARELVSFMGLDAYRDKQVQELSTGTRRITEIACLIALRPTALLLDEPSSGIAQRETEALGDLLLEVKRQLNTTLVVIEHDIPLIMGLADRIVAMESGRIIASGSPEQVQSDPLVIEAYLGGSRRAIERSGLIATGAKA